MNLRRFFSLVLITVFFTVSISACNTKQPFDFNEDFEPTSFNGEKLVIYQSSSKFLDPEPGETAVGDSLLNHLSDVEKILNIKIDISSYGNIPSRLLAAAASGNSSADIVADGPNNAFDMYKSSLLIPFEDIAVEDRTDIKWGTPSLLSETYYGGNHYGIFPYLWCHLPNVGGMLLVNMEIIEAGGFSDPHEYLEQGEWNWENMKKVFSEVTFNDENGEHIGMIFDSGRDPVLLPFVAIRSNGEEPISKSNGYYISNLESERAMEAYDYLSDMLSSGIIGGRGATDDLFRDTQLYTYLFCSSPAFVSEDVKTGYIPFAYGPGGNKDTVSSMLIPSHSLCGHLYFLFSSFTKFSGDELGVIADALFDPIDSVNYPNGWKDYYETNLFNYQIDYENFVKAVEGVSVISLAQVEKSYEIAYKGFDSFESGEAISSVISGISDAIQTEMNDKAK